MHVTFVKKRNADGTTCGKCADIEQRLTRDGHLERIDEIAIADVTNPDSPGMRLARELNTDYAPFFVVRDGTTTQVYTIYLKFVREVLQSAPRAMAQ